MYLLAELILFSPLILYACIRIRTIISSRPAKWIFVIFYILLFLGYPFAEVFSHGQIRGLGRYVTLAGYYCLPFLLYLTLAVLAIDLTIALLRGAKILRVETVSNARFRSLRFGCYFAIPALIVFAGAWNNNRLRIKEYSVDLPRKSSTARELKIVYASDFHLGQITNDRLLERFVSKVNALQPDIVLIGGDILEGHGNEDLDRLAGQFRRLRAKYGVFAAPGNHESHSGSPNNFFAQSGMQLLEDRVEKIDGKFYLAGRRDGHLTKKSPIGELLRTAPEDLPILLLDHSPTDLENVSRSRVDLQLSGHTHNGQLFPVNLVVMPFQYELAWGARTKGNTHFIVSSGVQAWGPPVKTAGDSEILFIKVMFRPDAGPLKQMP
jgi:uncharacterized protein